MNSQKLSLSELERIYSKKGSIRGEADDQFETLKVGKDEFEAKKEVFSQGKFQSTFDSENVNDQDIEDHHFNGYLESQEDRDDLFESQNLVSTSQHDLINPKYSNPIINVRKSLWNWRATTILMILIMLVYMVLNFWASLAMILQKGKLKQLPKIIQLCVQFFEYEKDILYSNYKINVLIELFGIMVSISAIYLLIFQRAEHIIGINASIKSIVKWCFLSIIMLYSMGILVRLIDFTFISNELVFHLFSFQIIKLVYFILTYRGWSKTIQLKDLHTSMLQKFSEMASRDQNKRDEIDEQWDKIND